MVSRAEINFLKTLGRERSARTASGLFIAEGAKLIADLSASGAVPERIFRVGDNVSASEMARMSGLKTPTTELAIFRMQKSEVERSPLALVLDGVQDPGNLGTIIRTADWFGINTIYCSFDTADAFAPKVVQATMGAVARVRVEYVDLGEFLKMRDEPILGTFLERATAIYDVQLPAAGIVVMGSEGHGISCTVERFVTQRIYIPRFGGGESLNVAVATAVVLSEFFRGGG